MIIETFEKEPIKKTRGEIRLFLKLKCDECGEVFEKPWHKKTSSQDFHFHSMQCMHESQKRGVLKDKKERTCMKNHGVKYPAQLNEVRDKQRATMIAEYGYSHNFTSPKLIEENRQKTITRNREDPSFAREEVKAKIKKTVGERYGVEHISQIEDVKRKKVESVNFHYGVDHPLQSKEIMAKKEQTCLARFGTKFPTQSKDIQERIRRRNFEKYGVDNPTKLASVQEKMQLTCLERYGERFYSQTNDFMNSIVGTGFYKHGHMEILGRVISYRSSYEKRFLEMLMCSDAVDIQQNVKLSYTFRGKTKRYFADFLVTYPSGKKILYEVKPSVMTSWDINIAKFEATRVQIHELGIDDFVIITENDLYPIERIE
jgi:hypothetical protein